MKRKFTLETKFTLRDASNLTANDEEGVILTRHTLVFTSSAMVNFSKFEWQKRVNEKMNEALEQIIEEMEKDE